jgi:hypothetical protein
MTLPLLPLASQYIQQIESKIDCDLINIKEWLLANKLSLNITKTEYLVIGSPFNLTSEPNIMIDNVPIKRVTKYRWVFKLTNFYPGTIIWRKYVKRRPRELVQSGAGCSKVG